MPSPLSVRGGVDRRADLLEGATAANIGERLVDVGVGRFRRVLEQIGDRHDHAGLTVAALRHVMLDPSLLHFRQLAILREAFDRGDLFAAGGAGQDLARARRDAVDVNRASAALADTATVFCASEPDVFADHPQQRGVGLDLDVVSFAIDIETRNRRPP